MITVGSTSTSGTIEGYDSITVSGEVSFSMTLERTQPLPPQALPNPPITFLFAPTMEVYLESDVPDSFTYEYQNIASATAMIYDVANPFSTAFYDYYPLVQIGNGSQAQTPHLKMEAYEGDTVVVYITSNIAMTGYLAICYDPVVLGFFECGTAGTTAAATVDPSFTFDQTTFDQLEGSHAFTLSDYYAFQFSPNIPFTAVPEPCTMLLLGSGLIGLAGLWRRFKK